MKGVEQREFRRERKKVTRVKNNGTQIGEGGAMPRRRVTNPDITPGTHITAGLAGAGVQKRPAQ